MVTKAQIRKRTVTKTGRTSRKPVQGIVNQYKGTVDNLGRTAKQGDIFTRIIRWGTELSLLPLIQWLLDTGRRVALPKTDGDNMDFYEIQDLNEVRKGQFGVMEPIGEQKVCWEDAICLTPGVGFSIDGGRIGHGAGYYDRYFERHPRLLKVGIAYEFQIVDHIPTEVTDIPLQWIVTPDRTIKTTKS